MIFFVWLADPLLRKVWERQDHEFSFGKMLLSCLWGTSMWKWPTQTCKYFSEALERNEIQDGTTGNLNMTEKHKSE